MNNYDGQDWVGRRRWTCSCRREVVRRPVGRSSRAIAPPPPTTASRPVSGRSGAAGSSRGRRSSSARSRRRHPARLSVSRTHPPAHSAGQPARALARSSRRLSAACKLIESNELPRSWRNDVARPFRPFPVAGQLRRPVGPTASISVLWRNNSMGQTDRLTSGRSGALLNAYVHNEMN